MESYWLNKYLTEKAKSLHPESTPTHSIHLKVASEPFLYTFTKTFHKLEESLSFFCFGLWFTIMRCMSCFLCKPGLMRNKCVTVKLRNAPNAFQQKAASVSQSILISKVILKTIYIFICLLFLLRPCVNLVTLCIHGFFCWWEVVRFKEQLFPHLIPHITKQLSFERFLFIIFSALAGHSK